MSNSTCSTVCLFHRWCHSNIIRQYDSTIYAAGIFVVPLKWSFNAHFLKFGLKQGNVWCNTKCLFYVLLNQSVVFVCQFVFGSREAHQKAAQSVAVKPLSQAVCVVNKMFHLQSEKKSTWRCVKMKEKKWRVVMSKNRTAESTHSNWVFNEMKGFCCRRSTLSVQSCWSMSKGVKS